MLRLWPQMEPSSRELVPGCRLPECAEYGFQSSKPAIVYYLRVSNPSGPALYKIGVTNRTVAERFPRDSKSITILEIFKFQKGAEAYAYEQRTLQDNAAFRYSGPDVLQGNGNDELFIRDVLGLDPGDDMQLEIGIDPRCYPSC